MRILKLVLLLLLLTQMNGHSQSLEEALRLTDNEQYDEAARVYKELIGREPSNGNLYYYLGENSLLGDNADSAKLVFSKGKEIDPANLLLKIGEAKVMLDAGNVLEAKVASDKEPGNTELKTRYQQLDAMVKKATQLIEEAVTAAPAKNATVLIEAADAYIKFSNKNLDRARQLLDKALQLEPKNINALLLYGDVYTELNNGTLAADFYNRALDLNKNSARAIVSKGRLYKRSTNYDGAAHEFEHAITIEPNYAPAHRELGETNFKLGKLSLAKENYRRYLELSKNNCAARIRYASFLYLSKDYKGAINELNQVQQNCDAGNLTLLRVFSYCYYELGEHAKGLEMVQKLFDRLPETARAGYDYEYYGKLLIASGQDSLGIIQLRKAYSIDPNKTELLSDLANAYYKIKQYSDAIDVLQEKAGLGKELKALDYVLLGRSFYFSARFVEADSAFMKLNEASPKYSSGWLWRAQANTHIDSTSLEGLAKPFYEKYIEIAEADSANIAKYNSGLVEAHGYLAYYYILKKDNASALIHLRKKLELNLDPEDKKNVQQAIDQLEGKKPGNR